MMPEDTGFGGDIYEEALHFKLQNVSGTIVVYDSTDEVWAQVLPSRCTSLHVDNTSNMYRLSHELLGG